MDCGYKDEWWGQHPPIIPVVSGKTCLFFSPFLKKKKFINKMIMKHSIPIHILSSEPIARDIL